MPKVEKFDYIDIDGKKSEIAYFVPSKEENLASLQDIPFIIASLHYFATGEGNQLMLASGRFKDEETMKEWLKNRWQIDPYFFIGTDFYINKLPPKEDVALKMLASENTIALWAKIIDGEAESGFKQFFAHDYTNFS